MDKWTSILTYILSISGFIYLTVQRYKAKRAQREREKAERWAQNGKMKKG